MFPDQDSARLYLEARLWPDGARCPVCGLGERITARKNGYYRCNQCSLDFTIRTETIMERSHVGLREWIIAMAIIFERPELRSEELAAILKCTPKTALAVKERLHEALAAEFESRLDKQGYRRVVGFEHAYRVGEDGSLWTLYRLGRGGRIGYEWRQLNPGLDRDGYRMATLTAKNGRQSGKKVAPLVCAAFHGQRPNGQECRHLNGIRIDDRVENLAWGTSQQNQHDRRAHGRAPTRSENGNAKLSEDDVAAIRLLKGKKRQRDIADDFQITQGHVSRIHRGAQW